MGFDVSRGIVDEIRISGGLFQPHRQVRADAVLLAL